jgi:PST family polysaccharide transporter/lipopolysaccharide exporter
LPIGIIIFIFGKDFLKFAYGPKWLGAGTVLQFLALAGIFNALPVVMGPLFLACGKPKYSLMLGILEVSIFFIFIIPFSKLFGLNGVGIVVSVASFITFFISTIWSMRLLSLSIRQLFLSLKTAILSTLLMSIGIFVLKAFFINSQSFFQININYRFFPLLICAIAIYIFVLLKTDRSFLKEIKEFI